jgi:hypothetical protein
VGCKNNGSFDIMFFQRENSFYRRQGEIRTLIAKEAENVNEITKEILIVISKSFEILFTKIPRRKFYFKTQQQFLRLSTHH